MIKNQQRIKKLYIQVVASGSDHASKEILKQWFRLICSDPQITQSEQFSKFKQLFQQSFQQWINDYLSNQLKLQAENIINPEFNQDSCMDCLDWIIYEKITPQIKQNQQQKEEDQNQKPQKINQEGKIKQSNSKVFSKHAKQVQKQQNLNQIGQKSPKRSKQQNNHQNQNIQNNNQFQQEKQHKQNKSIIKQPNSSYKKKTQKTSTQQNLREQQIQNLNNNQFVLTKQNQKNIQAVLAKIQPKQGETQQNSYQLPQPDQRYKDYLEAIFQHYCKITYGITKDNTFETIKKNTAILALNKFMIFCNDFQINLLLTLTLPKDKKDKLTKTQLRKQLMEVFRKHAQCQKQMYLVNFIQAIQRIGQIAFVKMKKTQKNEQNPKKTTYSYQLVKMIKFLQISDVKEFKQKMAKLKINYSLKTNKQLLQKKIPLNYKFKYETEQMKKTQTKQIVSSQRMRVIKNYADQNRGDPKPLLQIGRPPKPLNNKMSQPNIIAKINRTNQGLNNRQRNAVSTKNLSHQPRNVRNPSHLDIMPQLVKPPAKRQSVEKTSNPVIQGYTNIHLMKKGLLISVPDNSQSQLSNIRKKGEFQLHNIIKEAKHQVYYDSDNRTGRALSNISASKPKTIYSVATEGYGNRIAEDLNQNDLVGSRLDNNNSRVSQHYLKKSSFKNQLQNLIDLNQSDEDEYLQQHLNKQKQKTSEMGIRIDKKISMLHRRQ